jgi:hypothetical protein
MPGVPQLCDCLCLVLVCRDSWGRHCLGGVFLLFILGSNLGGGGPVRGLRGESEGGGVRSGPGAARIILLLAHTISVRPSKQPRMVGSTPGVYSFGLIFVSARTNKRHHHHAQCMSGGRWADIVETADSPDGDSDSNMRGGGRGERAARAERRRDEAEAEEVAQSRARAGALAPVGAGLGAPAHVTAAGNPAQCLVREARGGGGGYARILTERERDPARPASGQSGSVPTSSSRSTSRDPGTHRTPGAHGDSAGLDDGNRRRCPREPSDAEPCASSSTRPCIPSAGPLEAGDRHRVGKKENVYFWKSNNVDPLVSGIGQIYLTAKYI